MQCPWYILGGLASLDEALAPCTVHQFLEGSYLTVHISPASGKEGKQPQQQNIRARIPNIHSMSKLGVHPTANPIQSYFQQAYQKSKCIKDGCIQSEELLKLDSVETRISETEWDPTTMKFITDRVSDMGHNAPLLELQQHSWMW